MSGDSPNAYSSDNLFDFNSPAPTTSKDPGGSVVTASVLVEPPKEAPKDKEDKETEDTTDNFNSPILNNAKRENNEQNISGEGLEMGAEPRHEDNRREEQNLLNGCALDKLPNATCAPPKDFEDEDSDEDTCLVNCIYYTMECCRCTIV